MKGPSTALLAWLALAGNTVVILQGAIVRGTVLGFLLVGDGLRDALDVKDN